MLDRMLINKRNLCSVSVAKEARLESNATFIKITVKTD